MTSLDQNTPPLSAQRLAEIRRNEAEVADYIAHGLMRSKSAYQDRTDLLAEVDRLNARIAELEWLRDVDNGVGGISLPCPDRRELSPPWRVDQILRDELGPEPRYPTQDVLDGMVDGYNAEQRRRGDR
ncbi:hypothetical protein ACBJ59_36325 [Nonomuraea sp. MTCD27]|uniref:hypothetical protein n=1 Tax=Nonomuraea sp. MTCD27 TaxID=1676747 RepID=UPI0035C03C68